MRSSTCYLCPKEASLKIYVLLKNPFSLQLCNLTTFSSFFFLSRINNNLRRKVYHSIKSSSLFSGNNVPLRGLTKMRNHESRWSVREPHRERKIRKDYAFRESSNEAQPPVTSKSIKMTRGEDAYTPRHPNILTLEG